MSVKIARQELDSLTEFQKEIHVSSGLDEHIISTFYKKFIKATWTSCLPIKMKCTSDGDETVYTVNNSFHHLAYSYLRFTLPAIRVKPEFKGRVRVCWPHNVGTNIVQQASFREDDETYQNFDNVWQDFYFQFYQSGGAGKREAHNIGVGNVKCLEEWSEFLPAYPINVDQPWFYGEGPHWAYPIFYKGSLSRAEHRYTFRRRVTDLLRVQILDKNLKWKDVSGNKSVAKYLENVPVMIKTPELWGRFIYNTDQELSTHKCELDGSKTVYIRDVITCDATNPTKYKSTAEVQLECENPCLAMFWAVENRDSHLVNNFSNYTTDSSDLYSGWDPIKSTTLKYGTVKRLDNMPSDHFNIAEPRKHFPSAPNERGYHAYSFAWDSTNFDGDAGIVFKNLDAKLQCKIDNNNLFSDEVPEEDSKEEKEEDDDISEATLDVFEEAPTSPEFITRVRLLILRKFTVSDLGDNKYQFSIL